MSLSKRKISVLAVASVMFRGGGRCTDPDHSPSWASYGSESWGVQTTANLTRCSEAPVS